MIQNLSALLQPSFHFLHPIFIKNFIDNNIVTKLNIILYALFLIKYYFLVSRFAESKIIILFL